MWHGIVDVIYLFDLLFSSFEMGVELANLEDVVVGKLAYAFVEFIGKFWSMVARCMGLEARGSVEWTEEDDAVLVSHFLWKSGKLSL